MQTYLQKQAPTKWGCGIVCGTVDRAVAFDTRGPGLEESHQQKIYQHLPSYCQQLYKRDLRIIHKSFVRCLRNNKYFKIITVNFMNSARLEAWAFSAS